MKVWPFGVAGRVEAPNHHMLRWLKTVVVSDVEKASVRRQVGIRKMSNPEPLLMCRQAKSGTETMAISGAVGAGPGGCPGFWPGGVRHGGGMSLVCGSCRERGKARLDTGRRNLFGVNGFRLRQGAAGC
jgi:hypothetical protein